MALDISALTTAVANETSLDASAVTLIQGLAAQITALIASSGNTVDPTALAAIVTQMTTNATALSAALVANTPVTTAQAAATS